MDVCPLITAALRQIQIALTPKERTEVQLLTITTDPEIDSPKVLRAYAKRYGAEFENWAFLTGDPAVLAQVGRTLASGKAQSSGLDRPYSANRDSRPKQGNAIAYIGLSPDQHAVLGDVRSLLNGIRVLIGLVMQQVVLRTAVA